MQVYEASPDTLELTAKIEERWGTLRSQVTPDVAAKQPVRIERSLRADPEYQPAFRPVPGQVVVEVDLTPGDKELVDTLLSSGIYGETHGEAVRAAVMRWYNENVSLIPRSKIVFTDGTTLEPDGARDAVASVAPSA